MKRIIIVGGGYSGIAAAKRLLKKTKKKDGYEILLVEKNRYHTLMTQLHEVAGCRIDPRDAQVSYDEIFRGGENENIDVLCDYISEINFEENVIISRGGDSYKYDYLILATGNRPAFFGVEKAERNAFPLWSHKEAVVIAQKIADSFYLAKDEKSGEERSKYLNFSVAGGGFTGVEMVGELAYYCKKMCKKYAIDPKEVGIHLLEGADGILGTLNKKSARVAGKYLRKIGVEVLLGTAVEKVDRDKIYLKGGGILPGSLVWSAGIKGNPTPNENHIKRDRRDRVEVTGTLQSMRHENVFCIGDNAGLEVQGRPMPQIVEHARQSGQCAGENVLALDRETSLKDYAPKFHGSMVSVGPIYGVASIGKVRVRSIFATAMKHFVNLHYHFEIGGIPLAWRYIDSQFLRRFSHLLFSKKTGPLDKQVTQFYDVEE